MTVKFVIENDKVAVFMNSPLSLSLLLFTTRVSCDMRLKKNLGLKIWDPVRGGLVIPYP